MRPIEQVCQRVRWDDRFDPARFTLGVRQRDDRTKRVPLESFTAAGDVPWHRVRYVEADGQLVWDRDTGTDLLDTTTAGRRTDPAVLPAPFFTPSTPHDWHPERGWRPAGARPARGTGGPLRVVTWNTLWDRYDPELIHSARRRPLLLAELEAADADLIALQEVEPALVKLLLAQQWVRRGGYTLGADPFGREIDEHGLLLLSRLPVQEAGRHSLGPHKAVTAVTVRTGTGPLTVAAVHLSSDHSPDGAARRTAELAALAEGFAAVAGELLVLGDFNDGTGTPAAALGLRDAWTEVHGPDDRTPTFDPAANPLAAVSSLTGRAGRLDRVLLRPGRARTTAARLLGHRPDPDGLHPSDHYGLAVDLDPDPADGLLDAPTTARTAVAWLPPAHLWPPLQRLRARHDPQHGHWPPHVNLLFGFVAEHEFDRALPLLAEAAAEVPPFRTELAGVRTFEQPGAGTRWLDPAVGAAARWTALHQALQRRFPQCRTREGGYRPHLTLGRGDFPTGEPAPTTAEVGELVLLSRRGDGPMTPRALVALGTGAVRELPEPASPAPRAEPAVDTAELTARIAAALPGETHLVGSRRMRCHAPGADLDLVALLPGPVRPALIARQLTDALPAARNVREVHGARVPGLRLDVAGLAVDLVLAPADDSAEAATARSAVTDADAVLTAVGSRHAAFAALARRVRAWASARGLASAPFGQLPSLAWTVLAARTVAETTEEDPAALFRHFTETWAAWDWRHPVTLHGGPAAPHPDPVTVLTPTAPVRSCTTQVGPGTRDLLTEELYRAWELGPDHPELLAPPPLHRRHAAWLLLTPAPDRFGPTRGRLRALLTALEPLAPTLHAWPHPLPGPALAIGLGPTPPTPEALAPLLRGTLPDVPHAYLAGGELSF
ncbi:poly(A) polymerase [Kitasatospora phosalacinea]|uniref:poly(A) polymerase n=1 Tax=Kitasatospora phosalacinea TaxID=2065 RepID=UPI0035E2C0B3